MGGSTPCFTNSSTTYATSGFTINELRIVDTAATLTLTPGTSKTAPPRETLLSIQYQLPHIASYPKDYEA